MQVLISMDEKIVPNHIAIIPDGNRRWAKTQEQSALFGHTAGAKRTRDIVIEAADRGVKCLSIWGMSVENFTSRGPLEVKGLLNLFKEEFTHIAQSEEIHKRQVKVNVLGRWREKFPISVQETIQTAMDVSKDYTNHTLNFLLAYSGTDEMLRAIRNIAANKDIEPSNITGELLKSHLYTKDLPSVDLLIRTGGEPHLSAGFMMWDMADTQLYFTDVFYPDFSKEELDKALEEYARRERRFGK